MYHSILQSGVQHQLKKAGSADLVIGLPTYKNPQSTAHVASVILDGLYRFYPELRTVLLNADAGLDATTRRTITAQAQGNGHLTTIISGRYDGVLGQGSATAALLDAALALDAKAIVILDSRTTSIAPNWIIGLAHLVLENKADLVLPRYRHWPTAAGMMSDLLTYPLVRALWGYSIRRPAATDFALSPTLATTLLDEDVWGTAVAQHGLSPWLASYSTVNHWRVAQSALGSKVCTDIATHSQDKTSPFYTQFQDIVTVLFSLAYKYQQRWQALQTVQSLPTLTYFATGATTPVFDYNDNRDRLLDNLALGWIEYRTVWQRILTADNLTLLEALASLPSDQFYFPPDLWARIVYDFVVVFNKGEIDPTQVVTSLFPLYQGRLAAFLQEVAGLNIVTREGTVAAQAVEFEETLPYLKQRWQRYQPFA